MIDCPSCEIKVLIQYQISEKNTSSSTKKVFKFRIKYCDECYSYFNSEFIASKINYKQTYLKLTSLI